MTTFKEAYDRQPAPNAFELLEIQDIIEEPKGLEANQIGVFLKTAVKIRATRKATTELFEGDLLADLTTIAKESKLDIGTILAIDTAIQEHQSKSQPDDDSESNYEQTG